MTDLSNCKIVIILFLSLFFWNLNAQEEPCTAGSFLQSQLRKENYSNVYNQMEEEIQQWLEEPLSFRSTSFLPIVVHVVWNTNLENISDAQILSQIEVLNMAFSNSATSSKIPSQFKDLIGNPNLKFCLARLDPMGNPTNGITRTSTNQTAIGIAEAADGRRSIHYDDLGGKDAWDPSRYINIWIGNMESFLGRATAPNMGNPSEDGLVIDPDNFGSIGSVQSPFDLGKTLIHEMGHYFNLNHIWGISGSNTCSEDDGVEDTPNAGNPYFGCPNLPASSCNSEDLLFNYMDFSDDVCLLFFTKGQAERMNATLNTQRTGLINQSMICNPGNSSSCNLDKVQFLNLIKEGRMIFENLGTDLPVQIMVFNALGQMIDQKTLQNIDISSISTENYTPGVYFIVLNCGEAKISYKIVQPW